MVLENGNVLHGDIVDGEQDPLVLILPKGRISINRAMIAEWRYDDEDFQDLFPGMPTPGNGDDESPTIALDNAPTSDQEFEERYRALMEAITPLATNPEQALPSDLQMKDTYVSAIAALGERVTPRLKSTLTEGDPRLAPMMLKALGKADAAEGAQVAGELVQTHFDPEVREESIALIAGSERPDRNALLEEATTDQVWYVRSAAYEAMLDDWTTESLGKAVAGLEDADPDVRTIVQRTLEEGSGESFETVDEWRAWIEADTEAPADGAESPPADSAAAAESAVPAKLP